MSYPVPLRQASIPSSLKTHHVYYKPNPAIPKAQQWQSFNGCNCSGLTGVRVRDNISECRAGLLATRQGKLLSKEKDSLESWSTCVKKKCQCKFLSENAQGSCKNVISV